MYNAQHDHVAFTNAIKKKYEARQQRSQRRQEIGVKLIKGVQKMFGRGAEKSAPAKPRTKQPSKSSYIQNKRAANSINIGGLSPKPTPPNAYINAKREASRNYQYSSQRQKIKAPFKTR